MIQAQTFLDDMHKKLMFRFPNLSSEAKMPETDTLIVTISWCTEAQKRRVEANLLKWLKEYPQIKKYAVRVRVA